MAAIESSASPESPDRRLAALAAERHGVFTRADAVRLDATEGLIARRISEGRWERMHRGVYRLAGTPGSWRQRLAAAVLAGGGSAAASHRSAAAMWGLAGGDTAVAEISVPRGRRVREPGIIAHRALDLSGGDLTVVDAIPVTTPPRTLIDLAGVVPPEVVEDALDQALRRRLTSVAWLGWCLARLRRPGRRGVAAVEALLRARGVAESPLEARLLRLLRRAGLPEPICQYELRDGRRVIARVDFAYPDLRLAVEADGYEWHSSRARWQRDLRRGNELLSRGWRVIHVTARDVAERPDAVATLVATALSDGVGP